MVRSEIQNVKLRFGIIGNSEGLNRAIDIAIQVAPTDLSVLITGESGVGKENFPQIIHQFSRRKHGQYIAVNCGAIPEGTIDSELFGHEKGAFTGAISDRKGYFAEADGGTIFLDEVGELPLSTQARLLRVLESGEYIKVGSSKVQKTDVRIVAATNVNLTEAISEGRFREDLYYRLNTVPIKIPPLRERAEDIALLFRKFASDFAEKYRMPAIQLTEDAKAMLLAYPWPGNVRQLKNITEQISIIETNRDITPVILQNYLPAQQQDSRLPMLFGIKPGDKTFGSEREILYQVLFDMRRDVTELKKLVNTLMAERGTTATVAPATTTAVSYYQEPSRNLVPATPAPVPVPTINISATKQMPMDDDIQDTEEYVEETLSLDEVEKEMIRKALDRHHGKRKNAAKDLNISERTLYRKIKEYGLENVKWIGSLIVLIGILTACSVSYKFNGASIDYAKTKTISFENFPNRSVGFVWGPMENMFNTALQDVYLQQTRLTQVRRGGDLQLSGEITNYDAANKGIGSDGYSNMVELRMTVRVNFVDKANPKNNFNNQQFSASREYKSSQQLSSVQDELVNQMIKDIVDQIFNMTVANW